MREHPTLAQTEYLVRLSMQHLTDKAGRSLADHCARVAESVPAHLPDVYRHVAWLHDLIEDTDFTLADLTFMGYAPDVIDALALCTHDAENVLYMDYIRTIAESGNDVAITVKYLDNKDNSAGWRLIGLPRQTRDWLVARYSEAAPVLAAAMVNHDAAAG